MPSSQIDQTYCELENSLLFVLYLSFFWLLRLIPTTFVSLSLLYEAAEKGEEKEERKKEHVRQWYPE